MIVYCILFYSCRISFVVRKLVLLAFTERNVILPMALALQKFDMKQKCDARCRSNPCLPFTFYHGKSIGMLSQYKNLNHELINGTIYKFMIQILILSIDGICKNVKKNSEEKHRRNPIQLEVQTRQAYLTASATLQIYFIFKIYT